MDQTHKTIVTNPWHLEVTQIPVVEEFGGDEWNRQFLGRRGIRTTCAVQVMEDGKPVCSLPLDASMEIAQHIVDAHNAYLETKRTR